jgi:hypothetical protein
VAGGRLYLALPKITPRTCRAASQAAGETSIELTGPLAGDSRLLTSHDPTGRWVSNAMLAGPVKDIHARYGLTSGHIERGWEIYEPRFDLRVEPNEPFRSGYIVEIDPYDPTWIPKERTSLGRLKHEAATCALTRPVPPAVKHTFNGEVTGM